MLIFRLIPLQIPAISGFVIRLYGRTGQKTLWKKSPVGLKGSESVVQ